MKSGNFEQMQSKTSGWATGRSKSGCRIAYSNQKDQIQLFLFEEIDLKLVPGVIFKVLIHLNVNLICSKHISNTNLVPNEMKLGQRLICLNQTAIKRTAHAKHRQLYLVN